MEELIDFSDRDDEYLSTDIKQQALAFAIISAVVGFIFSSWVFLGKKVGPASEILDRKAAEGTVVTKRKVSGGGDSVSFATFRPPRIGSYKKESRGREAAWKSLPVASTKSVDKEKSKSKSEPRKKVADTSIGLVPDYKRKKTTPNRAVTKPAKIKKEPEKKTLDPERLLYPRVDERADPSSLSQVAERFSGNVVALGNPKGEYRLGLGLDSDGHALVSSAIANGAFLGRIWVEGTLREGRVVAVDSAHSLALIQIKGASFEPVTLAPAPPSPGEELVVYTSEGRSFRSYEARAGDPFGRASYFVEGLFGSDTVGAPLLNDRGELIGCYVDSLPGAPGNGFHLVADSAVLYRLVRGYKGNSDSSAALQDEAARQLAGKLAQIRESGEAKRGRLIPGVGLSDFHLGMNSAEVSQWVSSPETRSFSPSVERWDSPAPPVSLYFVNDRLALAATDHTGFATPTGLAPGGEANVRQLTRDYPELDLFPGLISVPGLDITVSRDNKVIQLISRPNMGGP